MDKKIKENSSSRYVQSTRQSKEEKMDAKISENEYILNNVCEYGITDAAGLKHRDLNYVTRSKSAKKEQRARAVQRSKTIYLNLSKGKNDGALAKLIEDSTEKSFSVQFLLRSFWKKKNSMKCQK